MRASVPFSVKIDDIFVFSELEKILISAGTTWIPLEGNKYLRKRYLYINRFLEL